MNKIEQRFLKTIINKVNAHYEAGRPNYVMIHLKNALDTALFHDAPVPSFYFKTENIHIEITGDIDNLLKKARAKNSIIFRGKGDERIISVPYASIFEFYDKSATSKGRNVFYEYWWSARLISRSIVEISYMPGDKVNGTHTSDGSGWPKYLISS